MTEFRLTPEQRQALSEALLNGHKISAIRGVREMSGLELKEAKQIVDRLEAELRVQYPERFATSSANSIGCVVLGISILFAAAALVWLLRSRSHT